METKGTVGSAASTIVGEQVGRQGGATLGATLDGAAETLLGPLGTAAGVEAGRRIGAEAGEIILGGAASDTAKEVTVRRFACGSSNTCSRRMASQ